MSRYDFLLDRYLRKMTSKL